MADGELTAKAARELAKRIPYPGFDVLFDHGDTSIDPPERVGNISSWFGHQYSSKSQLALLDIAVVDRHHDRAVVLVEIEETSSNPKVAIGDAFATILGDHITFQGTRHLSVGDSTALFVLFKDGDLAQQRRLDYLQHQIARLSKCAKSGNSVIAQIKFDFFQAEEDLLRKLHEFVKECLGRYLESK